jgi:hypothetical protein
MKYRAILEDFKQNTTNPYLFAAGCASSAPMMVAAKHSAETALPGGQSL